MTGDDSETQARLTEAGCGDPHALSWLLERHRPRLRRMIAMRLDERLSARVDPSDLVQETLADAARKLGDYLRDRPLPFYPWLHRLASERLTQAHRHHLGALKREAGRERLGGFPWADASGLRLADLLAAGGSSPSKHLIREEERQEVWRALGGLNEQDREILVMRYLDQLAFAEIAAVLSITESAARVRHFRALQRIGPLLGTAHEGPRA
jgi:RNA polymerase sigma-70 factor, ECF subfamily